MIPDAGPTEDVQNTSDASTPTEDAPKPSNDSQEPDDSTPQDIEAPEEIPQVDATPPDDTLCGTQPGRETPVTIDGRKLMVGESPIHMKGISWHPTPVGKGPGAPDFAGYVAQDAQLLADAGVNVVKTYSPILDTSVLDTLWSHGIYVLMTVYYGYADTVETAINNVCAVKEHPAILAWVVGNEWNYYNLGKDLDFQGAVDEVATVVSAIQEHDSSRPVATIYGELPDAGVLESLSHVDFWGTNVYRGQSFGTLFTEWESRSDKPLFLGEYGVDAYDGTAQALDEATQAAFITALTEEIHANASVNNTGVCTGGMVFEFNDEWWKFNGGPWEVQDTGASWQNQAYPDPNMNEEWWGLVDIERNPRQAYEAYKNLTPPSP